MNEEILAINFSTMFSEFGAEQLRAASLDDLIGALKLYHANRAHFNTLEFAIRSGRKYTFMNPESRDAFMSAIFSGAFSAEFIKAINDSMDERDRRKDTFAPPLTKPKQSRGFVYLMLNHRNGYHKIGHSTQPTLRENTLQSEEPEITLIGSWRGRRREELDLHEMFAGKRIRGEWFNLNQSDVAEIGEYFAAKGAV